MLAPIETLRGVDLARIGLDPERCERHAASIREHLEDIRYKLMEVYARPHPDGPADPDLMIYSGDFFSNADRALMNRVLATPPDQISTQQWPFRDPRLETMLFRFRARNYPDTLTPQEAQKWSEDRSRRLLQPPLHGAPGLREMQQELGALRAGAGQSPTANRVLDQLEAWYRELESGLGY
jgi:exodeoxyribonuclease-1